MVLLLLLTGCFSARVASGPSYGLVEDAPDVVDVDVAVDMMAWPKKPTKVPWARRPQPMFDEDAPCHFGVGMGLSGRFGREVATVGPSISGLGHCHATSFFGVGARARSTVFELGKERGGFAVGVLSPEADLGPWFQFGEGVTLELTGTVGYQLRFGEPSYPTAGGAVRLNVGILP